MQEVIYNYFKSCFSCVWTNKINYQGNTKIFQQRETRDQMALLVNSSKSLKKELIPILFKIFQKM